MCPGVTNFTAFFTPVPFNLSLQIGLGPLFTFAYLTLNTFSFSWPGGHPQHSCLHSIYPSFAILIFTVVEFPPDPSWIQRGSLISVGNPLTSSRFWNHWTSTANVPRCAEFGLPSERDATIQEYHCICGDEFTRFRFEICGNGSSFFEILL